MSELAGIGKLWAEHGRRCKRPTLGDVWSVCSGIFALCGWCGIAHRKDDFRLGTCRILSVYRLLVGYGAAEHGKGLGRKQRIKTIAECQTQTSV